MKVVKNITFWAIFLVILLVLSAILEPKNNTVKAGVVGRDGHAMGILGEETESLDVIFLGDSEGLTAVSPMEIWEKHGIPSYLCGQTGQRVVESYYWLRDIFDEQSPKLVVLETNLLYRYEGIFKELEKSAGETLGYYVPFFAYHNRWKNLSEKDLSLDFSEDKRNFMKGFECKGETVPYTGGPYMAETVKQQKPEEVVTYYVKKIMELCEENGASLMFMSVPSPVNWNGEKHNGVKAFADQHEIPYLDLNLLTQEVGIDWNLDSHDGGDHLNAAGAIKVTDYLGDYLAEHYELKNHKGEADYHIWEDDLKKYQEQMDNCRKGY